MLQRRLQHGFIDYAATINKQQAGRCGNWVHQPPCCDYSCLANWLLLQLRAKLKQLHWKDSHPSYEGICYILRSKKGVLPLAHKPEQQESLKTQKKSATL
ncbi:hypothetical protein TcWFU_004611 [Taenia crassiceps]|uniref:Uncharacterized protein n=1 Tax=Taenia crassiceps TaxID=6207 RepID=A0ABR4QHC8_9CEST